ncbi:MAG: hypothetical protein ACRECG_07640, partial [Bradyrhizobium sp.]
CFMPASSSPTCSREPASTARRHEIKHCKLNYLGEIYAYAPILHETNETIHYITRKNLTAIPPPSI